MKKQHTKKQHTKKQKQAYVVFRPDGSPLYVKLTKKEATEEHGCHSILTWKEAEKMGYTCVLLKS